MQLTTALHATLARYRPDPADREPFDVELQDGATVGDLLEVLGIPGDRACMVVMENARCERDAPVKPGVLVDVFPPLAGG